MPAKYFLTQKNLKKDLRKLPLNVHIKVLGSFPKIQENPRIGKKLKGELGDYFKYRVGDYRIIYTLDAKKSTVTIVKIEHRQGVYK